jgi:prepilin-type N-terminal cleavage/methylation domain-containing protein/prepilin-type processing-associated H-X9-DG protein
MTPAPISSSGHRQKGRRAPAFTLLELLVVLAVVAVCGVLLGPALARTQGDSRAFRCLNNTRELTRAWRLWTADNQDRLLYAAEDSRHPETLVRTWVMTDWDWEGRRPWDPTVTVMKSPMWPYCGTNLNIWRCPSDWAQFWVNRVLRQWARTYVMNVYLGGWGGTDGGWGETISDYRLYLKFSEINDPPPAMLFVFIDTRPDSVNLGCFRTAMAGYSPPNPSAYGFWDLPGASHDGAASFSFADGHSELHCWLDKRTTPAAPTSGLIDRFHSPDNADVAWLQDRATRPK